MVVVSQSGTYYVTPADTLIRITNNASVTVILPAEGSVSDGAGQAVTVQDAAGAATVIVKDRAGNVYEQMSNYEKLVVSWSPQEQEWFV